MPFARSAMTLMANGNVALRKNSIKISFSINIHLTLVRLKRLKQLQSLCIVVIIHG